jgi:hypothetical protein
VAVGHWSEQMNYKLVGSGAAAAILTVALAYMALSFGESTAPTPPALNAMIVLLGLAFGWLFGILLSPYSADEKVTFSEYAKAFGVFASGYLVGKIDKVVEELFKPDFVLDSLHGFRVMAFVLAFVVSMITTFVFRKYG